MYCLTDSDRLNYYNELMYMINNGRIYIWDLRCPTKDNELIICQLQYIDFLRCPIKSKIELLENTLEYVKSDRCVLQEVCKDDILKIIEKSRDNCVKIEKETSWSYVLQKKVYRVIRIFKILKRKKRNTRKKK